MDFDNLLSICQVWKVDVDSGKWMMSLESVCQAWEVEVFESGRAVVESGKRLLNL